MPWHSETSFVCAYCTLICDGKHGNECTIKDSLSRCSNAEHLYELLEMRIRDPTVFDLPEDKFNSILSEPETSMSIQNELDIDRLNHILPLIKEHFKDDKCKCSSVDHLTVAILGLRLTLDVVEDMLSCDLVKNAKDKNKQISLVKIIINHYYFLLISHFISISLLLNNLENPSHFILAKQQTFINEELIIWNKWTEREKKSLKISTAKIIFFAVISSKIVENFCTWNVLLQDPKH